MASIDFEVEDYLDECALEYLIRELSRRFKKGNEDQKKKITSLFYTEFKIKPSVSDESIDEQSKRELIEQFIHQIPYQTFSQFIKKEVGYYRG
jgi:hypothetical protein